ncbi:helix-turn-helix transcriptional regulator [Enterobacter cancerogenus]
MKPDYAQQIVLLTSVLEAAMDALSGTVSNNQEIVLHNLTTPEHSVQKIINGHVSGRKKGDGLLSGPDKDAGFAGLLIKSKEHATPLIIKNYKTTSASGKIFNSASTIYYGTGGEPLMAFCINVDSSPNEQIRKALEALDITAVAGSDSPEISLGTIIDQTVRDIIEMHAVPHQKIRKTQRQKIVSEMYKKGVFKMKGGVQYAANALGVTRYTIYNDLEVLDAKPSDS